MTNGIAIKKEQKREALQVYRAHKAAIMNSEEVQSRMNDAELQVIERANHETVREIENVTLAKKLLKLSTGIARDAGIKDWRNESVMKYDGSVFVKLVSDHFKDLTLQEVKYAFEASDLGFLDKYLPRDKHGEPEKNHYQSFSREFIVRILKAYRQYKGGVWTKAQGLLPVQTKTATIEELKEYRDSFTNKIHERFEAYKNDGVIPIFLRPQMVLKN